MECSMLAVKETLDILKVDEDLKVFLQCLEWEGWYWVFRQSESLRLTIFGL